MKTLRPVDVFMNARYVTRKTDGRSFRHAIELVARKTGTLMYLSKTCDTQAEAIKLARAYLAKNPDLHDTTAPNRFPEVTS